MGKAKIDEHSIFPKIQSSSYKDQEGIILTMESWIRIKHDDEAGYYLRHVARDFRVPKNETPINTGHYHQLMERFLLDAYSTILFPTAFTNGDIKDMDNTSEMQRLYNQYI